MNIKFLMPHRFKTIGWILLIPGLVIMFLNLHYEFAFSFLEFQAPGLKNHLFDSDTLFTLKSNNFTDELASLVLITGLLLVAFSKEREEDERIARLRLESLLWAVLVNTVLILLAIIFLYNGFFLQAMAYNICTPLILFIARFHLVMYKESRNLKTEGL